MKAGLEKKFHSLLKIVTHTGLAPILMTKAANNTVDALLKFTGTEKVSRIYTHGSGELAEACAKLEWPHDVSTPYRPQTNGVAERAVRRVLEGTRSILLASGLSHEWWPTASECFAFLSNVTDTNSEGMTPFQMRFGQV